MGIACMKSSQKGSNQQKPVVINKLTKELEIQYKKKYLMNRIIYDTEEVNVQNLDDTTQLNQYTIVKTIGKGSIGKVKLAVAQYFGKQQKFAIKFINKQQLKRQREIFRNEQGKLVYKSSFENVLREIAIMKKLNHQNICRIYEVMNDPQDPNIYLVLEYLQKGQLIEWNEQTQKFYRLPDIEELTEENNEIDTNNQKPFGETKLRLILRSLLLGLHYLHQNNVCHRDIKPQNILVDSQDFIKIVDFGTSDFINHEQNVNNTVGTYYFMSPESLNLKKGQNYDPFKADIWSLGITMYCFAYYDVPFSGKVLQDLFTNIINQKLTFPQGYSQEFETLMTKIIDRDVNTRLTLEQIMEDPWINKDQTKLKDLIEKIQKINVNDDDVKNAITIDLCVSMKQMGKYWNIESIKKERSMKRSLQQSRNLF